VEDDSGVVVPVLPVVPDVLLEVDALVGVVEPGSAAVPACVNVFNRPTAVYKGVVELLPPSVATILESKLNFTAVLVNPEFDDGKTGLVYEGVVAAVVADVVLVMVDMTLPLI